MIRNNLIISFSAQPENEYPRGAGIQARAPFSVSQPRVIPARGNPGRNPGPLFSPAWRFGQALVLWSLRYTTLARGWIRVMTKRDPVPGPRGPGWGQRSWPRAGDAGSQT